MSDKRFDALVLATGPSIQPWLEGGDFPDVPKYGCSWVSWHVKLDVYAIGDVCHHVDIPPDKNVRIIASERAMLPDAGMELFDERFPHGSQTGGMAITAACREHKRVALIGFDGGLPEPYESDLRSLLAWWRTRGRRFYSLMPKSTFDDLMEKA